MFLVRASNGSHYALKRISVNNRKDLDVGKLEISIMVSLGVDCIFKDIGYYL